ncbi:MAG: hypothetical protein IPM79_17875 [Polyangiaceae bacterium]|jgi:hypothetical protein|nr:hypothetical protein [Polyangiaceae bacterium]
MDPLAALLSRWRETRSRHDAEELERQTSKALRRYDPPALGARFHEAWLERAQERADPLTTGWLAATLATRLGAPKSLRQSARPALDRLRARVEALSLRGPDPRIAAAVIDVIDREPVVPTVRQGPEHAALLELLISSGDPRQAAALSALAARARQRLEGQRALRAEARARRVSAHWLVAGAPAALEALTRKSEASGAPPDAGASGASSTLSALLARVMERWDDDAPLAVLADFLARDGLALGDYLHRFLAAPADARPALGDPPRAARAAWLGPDLTVVLNGVGFERGLPVSAALSSPAAAADVVWRRAMGAPALATLRELRRGRASVERYARFLASPALVALRRVEIEQLAELDGLLEVDSPRCVRELRFSRYAPNAALLARLAAAPAFAQLSHLASRGGAELVDRVHVGPLASRLRSLEVLRSTSDAGGGVLARFERFPDTLARLAVDGLALSRERGALQVEVEAPPRGSLSRELAELLPEITGAPHRLCAHINRWDTQALAPFRRWANKRGIPVEVSVHPG